MNGLKQSFSFFLFLQINIPKLTIDHVSIFSGRVSEWLISNIIRTTIQQMKCIDFFDEWTWLISRKIIIHQHLYIKMDFHLNFCDMDLSLFTVGLTSSSLLLFSRGFSRYLSIPVTFMEFWAKHFIWSTGSDCSRFTVHLSRYPVL